MKTKIKTPTIAERQCVLLAYRDIFAEKNARVWTNKAIHSLVQQHWSSNKSLVGGCGINKVVRILKALLNDGILESKAKVGKEFPNFVSKPSQNGCWVERGGALDTANAALGKRNASLEKPGVNDDPEHECRDTLPNDPGIRSIERGHARFTLQPPLFPYETQHRILSTIQQLLEESCFNFVKKWLPSVLKKHSWNCAAAGELTEWLYILRRYARDLPNSCISIKGQASLHKIAPTIARLRHTAVHRLHLTSDEFLGLIRSAFMLAEVLQNVRSTSTLQALYGRVDTHSKKMDYNIKATQQEVDTTFLQIQREREALAQREQQLVSYAAQQSIDIPVATGLALLESINAVLAPSNPNIVVEKHSIGGHDGNAAHTYGVIVEDDIESDEDQLQAELR